MITNKRFNKRPHRLFIQCLIKLLLAYYLSYCMPSVAVTENAALSINPLLNEAYSTPTASKEMPAEARNETPEQFMYRINVEHALVAQDFLKNDWPMRFVEKALTAHQHFDQNESDILSKQAELLLGLGAPIYKTELPALYAQMDKTMQLMDKAESEGLYQPPANLLSQLNAWRAVHQIQLLTEQAPWIVGPQQVNIDPDLHPIQIPPGFKFLYAKDRAILEKKLFEIRQATLKQLKPNDVKLNDTSQEFAFHWLMPVDGSWSGSIMIVKNRHVPLDVSLPKSNAVALSLLQSRLDPISNLKFDANNSYARSAVRWLVQPEKNTKEASIRWAFTDGNVSQALSINYIHMVLGANQQLILFIETLKAPEVFLNSSSNYDRYFSKGRAVYSADFILKQTLNSIQPMLSSLAFVKGKQVENSIADASNTFNSADTFITGQASLMEQGVKRMIAEQARKSNFWYFLEDHPRYKAYVIGALIFIILGVKSAVENFVPDERVWVKIAARGLVLLGIVVLIISGFIMLLPNFT